MLVVDGLEVRYHRARAVHDVTLEVRRGEVVGLIGPNGAGKSSTLAAIAGLERPSAGRITFDGDDITAQRPERIVRHGIATVPEGRHIFSSLTVAENLALGATARGDRRAVAADMERELERFPMLRRYFKTAAGKLSGGEQQQLAIARALISRPRLLLLDEPSFGLAPLMVDAMFAALAQLRDEEVTVLLVEQNATRAVEFADRSYVMRSGRIVRAGSANDLRRAADMAEAYLGV